MSLGDICQCLEPFLVVTIGRLWNIFNAQVKMLLKSKKKRTDAGDRWQSLPHCAHVCQASLRERGWGVVETVLSQLPHPTHTRQWEACSLMQDFSDLAILGQVIHPSGWGLDVHLTSTAPSSLPLSHHQGAANKSSSWGRTKITSSWEPQLLREEASLPWTPLLFPLAGREIGVCSQSSHHGPGSWN